jgi:uncharacterized protein YdbL (DUF1318 family)
MKTLRAAMAFSLALLVACASTAAEGPTLPELKKRFKERIEQLNALKAEGKVGETLDGRVAAVDPSILEDEETKAFLEAENADRQSVYRIMAKQEGTSPETVARINAKRNYEKAQPGAHLQQPGGEWVQKEVDAGVLPPWFPAD